MKKRVLLTGASGFIGRNFIEQAASSYDILAPGHKDLDLVDTDSVHAFFRDNAIDAVLHAATKPGHRNATDPVAVGETNLRMFLNLFEASRRADVKRFLFLGSGSEFDMRHYRPGMREDSLGEFVPADDTGFSKLICSRILSGNPGYVNVRFFGIFGKYEDYAIRFISNAIAKTICDLPITLRQDRLFSYTYIDDGIRAIMRFLDAEISELRYNDYNVTPDQPVSLLHLANLITEISGKKDIPILVGAPGLGLEYSGNNDRFSDFLPDFEFTPIEKSVRELYAWYENRRDQIDRHLLLTDK